MVTLVTWMFAYISEAQTGAKRCMLQLVLSLIAEAESVEGLFDVFIGLWYAADTEDVAGRNILLQLSFSEDHRAFSSFRPRTCQQEVGSMTPTLQQCS